MARKKSQESGDECVSFSSGLVWMGEVSAKRKNFFGTEY
jgi:hypothetical protein